MQSTRKNVQVQERRSRVAEMYLRGKMQTEIAAEFGVNVAQISRDLKAIRQEWLKSRVCDFDTLKTEELAKINALEVEYWQAWQQSRKFQFKRFSGKAIRVGVRRVVRDGNPAFLQGVQWCISERCKILGIYEATKIKMVDWRKAVEEQGHDAGELFERMVNVYIRAINGDAA